MSTVLNGQIPSEPYTYTPIGSKERRIAAGFGVYQIQCDPSVPVSRNRLITGTRTPANEHNGFLRSIKAQAPFQEEKIPIQICIEPLSRPLEIHRESLYV